MEHRISYEFCRKEYIPARTTSMYQVIVHLRCENKHLPLSFDLGSAFSIVCSDSLSHNFFLKKIADQRANRANQPE
jgi:hypothetical protein